MQKFLGGELDTSSMSTAVLSESRNWLLENFRSLTHSQDLFSPSEIRESADTLTHVIRTRSMLCHKFGCSSR